MKAKTTLRIPDRVRSTPCCTIRSGSRLSRTWSRPGAWPPEASPSRRLMKLVRLSPSNAPRENTSPVVESRPSIHAQAIVIGIEKRKPRQVFEGPKRGRPSRNRNPQSNGEAKRFLNNRCPMMGARFATMIKISNLRYISSR